MKFSGNKVRDIFHTYKCVVTMDINQYGFYGNMFAISVKYSHMLQSSSKTIQSIFMKFSGHMSIVISYNQTYIVTMDIHQCGFYGNISVTIHQTFLHFWSPLKEYLINLHEIFSRYGHCHLLQLNIHCYYGDPSMWFLWQHICHTSLNFLTCLSKDYISICGSGEGTDGLGASGGMGVSLNMCTCTYMHTHTQNVKINMLRNCKWPPPWRQPCLLCLTYMHVHMHMRAHACMCMHMHGGAHTQPHLHPPGGVPPNQ